MKASKVQALLTKILELHKEQSEWLAKLPKEINDVFFDNPHVSSKDIELSIMLDFIFDTWAEDVSYFLYESSPHRITTKKGEYVINDVKEYIDYMVTEGFLEEDRS